MFRCTDCNTEYKIKPDYCDCGNNMFDEVPDQMPFRSYTTVPAGQIISIIIFIFCLILAAIPWTIPAHKSKPAASPAKREKQEANIPDIDKIWNDKTAKTDAKPITAQKTAAEPENLPASRILTTSEGQLEKGIGYLFGIREIAEKIPGFLPDIQ